VQLTFVGGVGHADAALVAERIGATPGWAALPVELGFHAEPRGIGDLLEGRITLAGFREAIGERWWAGRLERIVSAEQLAVALDRLTEEYERDPVAACRRLVEHLVEPFARRSGESGVVEATPTALVAAPILDRLFGEAEFVHAVRDGRELAARELGEHRTPAELLAGIARWAGSLREIDAGVRVREEGAIYGVWPDRLRVELLRPDAPGSWGHGLSRRERRRVTRRYVRTLRSLVDDGLHCAPDLVELVEEDGA
jgi:hypothetical protein